MVNGRASRFAKTSEIKAEEQEEEAAPAPAADTEKKPAEVEEEKEKPAAETKVDEKPAAETKVDEKPAAETKVDEKPAAETKVDEKPEAKDDGDGDDKPMITDRDVIVSEDGSKHKGNLLLLDLIRLHYLLLTYGDKSAPKEEKEIDELAAKLTQLVLKGKHFELAGLKDVPKPFLTGEGRFLEVKDSIPTVVSEQDAKTFVVKTILSEFKSLAEQDWSTIVPQASVATVKEDIKGLLNEKKIPEEEDASHSAPRPCDVLFLPMDYPVEENMPYEHQSGNKHLLFLASQHVASDTNASPERLEAAIKLVTCKVEINCGTELVQKTPRYVVQQLVDNQNSWKEMDNVELIEFAVIFVFEVYLEKQIHGVEPVASSAATTASKEDQNKPSDKPVENATPHDVLFGRGGMTNGHPGNRRFRDIIALHRPDYIRATKMDKPNVARRIVRAIRQGNPPGRFMKKGEDGKWYDVGDRTAAEKTSQGLRERSNAEKRQRTALREALRIRREDLEEETGESASKKAKITDPSGMGQLGLGPGYVAIGGSMNYAGAIPLSLSMKERPREPKAKRPKKEKGDASAASEEGVNSETLPPNAVDKDGNILVTDYDILCGRGGLTNHHKGNKRFRDIVALHRPDYVRAPKIQKPSVARVIVRAIRNGDPPGRFLRKDEKAGKWCDIGDKRAAEKTSQALREKTNEEKDGPTPTTPFTSPTVFLPSSDKTPTTTVVDTTVKAENTDDKDDEKKKEDGEGKDEEAKEDEKKTDDGDKAESNDEKKAADESKNMDDKKTEDDKKVVAAAEETVEV